MFDCEKTSKAFELANFAHRHQIRKGINIPYISHPMGVASQVLVWGGAGFEKQRWSDADHARNGGSVVKVTVRENDVF